jgi:MFS transporter, PPP family, 3-phenylpropionic acid transporter
MSSLVSARRFVAPADLAMVAPAIVYVALFAGVGAWYPYQSVLLASRGLDFGQIGLLLALNAVVMLVAAPLWGAVADRAGVIHRPLLVASVVAAIGAAWLAFAHDVASTAAALAVMAAGAGGVIPLADTRTIELAGSDRNRFGRARAFGSAAFIGGAVVTGVLVSGRSPDALFALFVPLLLVTGLASYRLLAPGPADAVARARRAARPRFSVRGFVGLLGRPGLFALLVGTTLVWTAVAALMTFIGIRVADLGGDLAIVGLVSSGSAVVEVPIMLAFPAFAHRLGVGRLVVLGAAAFALRAVLWAFAPSPAVILLVSPLGGVGFAFFYVGIVTFVARAVPAEAQATAQGVYSGMTFSLGSVVGTAVAGGLAPILGLPGLFLAAGVATFVGTIVVARGVTVAGRSLPAAMAPAAGPLLASEPG